MFQAQMHIVAPRRLVDRKSSAMIILWKPKSGAPVALLLVSFISRLERCPSVHSRFQQINAYSDPKVVAALLFLVAMVDVGRRDALQITTSQKMKNHLVVMWQNGLWRVLGDRQDGSEWSYPDPAIKTSPSSYNFLSQQGLR